MILVLFPQVVLVATRRKNVVELFFRRNLVIWRDLFRILD
jgi:hypothetical protein